MLAATIAFAAREARTEEQYIPYPATWLNGCRFNDVARSPATVSVATVAPVPAEFSDDKWLHILRRFADRGEWSDGWGPRPGEPNCHAPSHLTPRAGSLGTEVAVPLIPRDGTGLF